MILICLCAVDGASCDHQTSPSLETTTPSATPLSPPCENTVFLSASIQTSAFAVEQRTKYEKYLLQTAPLGLGGLTGTFTVVKQEAEGHFLLLCPPAGNDQLPKRQIPHPRGLNKQWALLAEDGCTLALRLRPDSSLKPESAHTQPTRSLAHIQENTH